MIIRTWGAAQSDEHVLEQRYADACGCDDKTHRNDVDAVVVVLVHLHQARRPVLVRGHGTRFVNLMYV